MSVQSWEPELRSDELCKNLYFFIRLRLGRQISDREIARRWGMEWKSFSALKHGRRRVPRIDELADLARVIDVDPAIVFEVARGGAAHVINQMVEREDREAITSILLASMSAAGAAPESRFRADCDRIDDAIFTLDLAGNFKHVNPHLEALSGYTADELASMSIFDLVDKAHASALLESIGQVSHRKTPRSLEVRSRFKTGSPVALTISLTQIADADAAYAIQGIARDMTQLKEAEARLRRSEAVLRAVPDVMFRLDAHGQFREYFPGRGTWPHEQPEAVVGKSLSEVLPDRDDVVREALALVQKTLDTQEPHDMTVCVTPPLGTEMVPSGPDEVLTVVRDITAMHS
jgi:PAS domain S-box-containing protein